MIAGILGGTFDPIHRGHLWIAKQALRILQLDEVILMVADSPPHKSREEIRPSHHRFAMAVLATINESRCRVSGLELGRRGPSYTIDTLEALQAQSPENEYCFIAGTDSLKEIHLWRQYDRIFEEFSLVFVQRPGVPVDLDHLKLPERYKKNLITCRPEERATIQKGQSVLLQIDPPPISSTELRRAFRSGRGPSAAFIHPRVANYIHKYRLYE